MAVFLAYQTGSFAPENMPKAFMFAAKEPIASLADELRPLTPGGLPADLSTFTTVKLFDRPMGGFADCSFDGHAVNYRGSGRGNSFPISANDAGGNPVWLIFRPQGVPAQEARFHSALIAAANAAAAVTAAKALAGGGYPNAFEGYRVVQVGAYSATTFKNTIIEGDAVEYYGLTRGGDQPVRMVPNAHTLGVAAGTAIYQTVPTGRKGVAKEFFSPANVLRARNVVIIGASIEEYTFGNATQGSAALKQHVVDLANRLGFQGTIQGRAVASEDFADIILTAQAAKAEFASTQGQNVYIAHIGGNDVSARRPYIEGDDLAFFQSNVQAIYNILKAGGDQVIFTNISKRLYPSGTPVLPLPAEDASGSKPYNEAIMHPFIKANMPEWWDWRADRPYLDLYSFTERHEDRWTVVADGVHPHIGSYASLPTFYLGRLAAKANGLDNKPGVRSGRSFIYIPRSSASTYPVYTANLNHCRVDGQGQPHQGKGVITGGFDLLGAYDPFIEFSIEGVRGLNSGGGAGSGAHARIDDVRLQLGDFLLDSMYADQTTLTPEMRFAGLVPGETGWISIVGSRALSDAIRRCTWSVNGADPKIHDAAANAASNVQSWAFTVPASGIVDLTGVVATGGGITGYISAVMIEFD